MLGKVACIAACGCMLAGVSFAQVEFVPFGERLEVKPGTSLFEDLSTDVSGVSYRMQLPDIATHVHELLHLSVYGGICTGDYDGDDLADFYVTSPRGGNRLFRNIGGFKFEDVTESTGVSAPDVWGTGASFIDIDNDGDLDIYACAYGMPNKLFINQGRNGGGHVRFVEKAAEFGLDYTGGSMNMAFADIDNDGDLDGYLVTTAMQPPRDLKFRVEYEGRRPVIPKELQEYWGMIYLPGDQVHRTEAGQFDHLYRNDGDKFVEISEGAGIDGPFFTLAAIWWDFNADGLPDLYVANDYLGADQLYLNNGDGTFRDVIRDTLPHTPWSSMGMDIGDLNNDGRMDLMATDMLGSTHYRRHVMMGETSRTGWFLDFAEPRQYSRNAVYLNTGTARMMEVAYLTGLAATDWTWTPRMEDFDNDGHVDVLIANGMLRDVQHADIGNYADRTFGGGSARWARFWSEQQPQREANMAFRNGGELDFKSVGKEWGFDRIGVSLGIATADFDNDGDLDVVVNNADAPVSVLRNTSTSGNRLRVQLKGRGSNAFGLGATIRVETVDGILSRYMTGTRAWLSAGEPVVHFGLGAATNVNSLEVTWPGGGKQTLQNVPANQSVTITEADKLPVERSEETPMFEESSALRLAMDLEVPFDDFQRQPLLPRRISQDTFCMAWADLNADGIDDLFLGGSQGQTGRFFISDGKGGFDLKGASAFAAARASVDACAFFFDADSDGDLDLYIGSGGSRDEKGSAAYLDRIYLNDGNLNWTDASDRLPMVARNTSAVVTIDADGDGDLDLFVGGGAIPGAYPKAENSYALINEGGSFAIREDDSFGALGLVTGVDKADLDGDGRDELIVATEWGPVRILRSANGEFIDISELAGTAALTGLWRSVRAADLDADGDIDFIAGNIGLNSQFRASVEAPEEMYYGDIESAQPNQIVEVYSEGARRYTRRGFDALSRAMPALRQRFQNFHFFAVSSVEQVFAADELNGMSHVAVVTRESAVFVNDGKGVFDIRPLPRLSQASPVNDIAIADLNRDGRQDLVLAQNDFSFHRSAGRMDGGLSTVLLGASDRGFEPMGSAISGILIPEESRRVSAKDVNGDGLVDLIFGVRAGSVKIYLNGLR